MRILVQVVDSAEVSVEDRRLARIGPGLCVYVGVEVGDEPEPAGLLAVRISRLRIMAGDKGPFDRCILDTGGEVLVVSNFTLAGRLDSGRRPSWSNAMPPGDAQPVFDAFVGALRAAGVQVATGEFGAEMTVTTTNHGPTNLVLNEVSR